jgi:hypothetical protein
MFIFNKKKLAMHCYISAQIKYIEREKKGKNLKLLYYMKYSHNYINKKKIYYIYYIIIKNIIREILYV